MIIYINVFIKINNMIRNGIEVNRVKTFNKKRYYSGILSHFPNFHSSGSITGMKKLYYGWGALLVRCNGYIYNVTSKPDIYNYLSY